MPLAWFWPMFPEPQPRVWIRQDKGLCPEAIQIRLPGLNRKVYLDAHKCTTLSWHVLFVTVYIAVQSIPQHPK